MKVKNRRLWQQTSYRKKGFKKIMYWYMLSMWPATVRLGLSSSKCLCTACVVWTQERTDKCTQPDFCT